MPTFSTQKMTEAQKHYWIQKALGRPLKKYNLLICKDDGDWFSSDDNLKDGLIMDVLGKLEKQDPIRCYGWRLMYLMQSRKPSQLGEGEKQFFCYIMMSDIRTLGGEKSVFDKYEYLTWNERHSQ